MRPSEGMRDSGKRTMPRSGRPVMRESCTLMVSTCVHAELLEQGQLQHTQPSVMVTQVSPPTVPHLMHGDAPCGGVYTRMRRHTCLHHGTSSQQAFAERQPCKAAQLHLYYFCCPKGPKQPAARVPACQNPG